MQQDALLRFSIELKYIYIYIIPELSSSAPISLTHHPPLCSPANHYLVHSLPLPLPSAPFLSFALPFHSLLLPHGSGPLLPCSLASLPARPCSLTCQRGSRLGSSLMVTLPDHIDDGPFRTLTKGGISKRMPCYLPCYLAGRGQLNPPVLQHDASLPLFPSLSSSPLPLSVLPFSLLLLPSSLITA